MYRSSSFYSRTKGMLIRGLGTGVGTLGDRLKINRFPDELQ